MLIKRTQRHARRGMLIGALPRETDDGVDRRALLRRSGLAVSSLATLGALPLGSVRKAKAGPPPPAGGAVIVRKSVCTHCSVGCTVHAEVANGVWIGQEPAWESPINRGSHCAKGASVRELVSGERRLKYPMKMANGQWTRVTWDQAIGEIGDKILEIRTTSGPDSVYWLGSAKMTNEASYLFRKFGAFWGTNNTDHQARICHSTTVTGVANTWGYGAMTNSYNDIRNAKTVVIWGGNPAEAHPVSLQHLLEGQELNRANFIVVDPRLTRTAAHATEYVRLRPGTDIPVLYGMMWHIIQNGRTRNSSSSVSTAMRMSAKKSRSGPPRKSSGSVGCRASSSSAWRKCSRPRSRRPWSGAWGRPSTRWGPPMCGRVASPCF